MEVLGWGIIIITDLLVSWAFYAFLKEVHPTKSLIGGLLRLGYILVLTIAVANLVTYKLLQDNLKQTLDLAQDIMTYILAFENIWSSVLIIF